MSIKPLIILPDPVLRQVSRPVERVDDALRRLAGVMLEAMYDAPGLGVQQAAFYSLYDVQFALDICGDGFAGQEGLAAARIAGQPLQLFPGRGVDTYRKGAARH